MNFDWAKEIKAPVTMTDAEGIINYMNDASINLFERDGGETLIGTNLFDCHNEKSNEIIKKIIESGEPNVYTIEKNGVKKLIYQAPYFDNGTYAGLVELSIVLPEEMPHFKRD